MHVRARIAQVRLGVMLGLALAPLVVFAADDKVRILIRGFIPNSYPSDSGELLPLPGTPRKMILLDYGKVPVFGQILSALGKPLKHCFAIDDRGFSSNPTASSRVTGDFVLVASTTPKVETAPNQRFRSGTTRKYDCITGQELEAKNADLSACALGTPAYADGKVQVVLGCKAADPLVPYVPEKWTPDLHFNGTFMYSIADKKLSFKGDVGAFPSFEAYASRNGGPFRALFQVAPAKGADGQALVDLWQHLNVKNVTVGPVGL